MIAGGIIDDETESKNFDDGKYCKYCHYPNTIVVVYARRKNRRTSMRKNTAKDRKVGKKEFKASMEEEVLSIRQWLTHLQEELMDAAVYVFIGDGRMKVVYGHTDSIYVQIDSVEEAQNSIKKIEEKVRRTFSQCYGIRQSSCCS